MAKRKITKQPKLERLPPSATELLLMDVEACWAHLQHSKEWQAEAQATMARALGDYLDALGRLIDEIQGLPEGNHQPQEKRENPADDGIAVALAKKAA